jgi:hypothetical protein
MTDQVLIKKIGFVEIRLRDDDIDEFSWKQTLTITSIIAILSIITGYLIALTKQSDIFINSLGLFITLLLISILSGVFYINIPAYRVSTNAADINNIYIKKTTEEADQIAICKAATDIENQIKTREEKLEKLKQIAEKCK